MQDTGSCSQLSLAFGQRKEERLDLSLGSKEVSSGESHLVKKEQSLNRKNKV